MNHKLTNLTNKELASIFGGDYICCCIKSKINSNGNSVPNEFYKTIIEQFELCPILCADFDYYIIYDSKDINKIDDSLLQTTPIYDRISSAHEYGIVQ